MTDHASLEQRLASLLEDSAQRRAQERTQRETDMQELEPRRIRFEQIAGAWLNDLVLPRLRALAQALPQAGDIEHVSGGRSARLKLGWSKEYPVGASLTVSITPNGRYDHASVHIQPLLIPMLVGHPSASCCEFKMDVEVAEPLAQFLDDQLVIFAESYLRVREPDSPHQRSSLVTDPVCGMTFHPTDAVESHDHQGRRFFFCAASCAERFRQSPDLYLRWKRESMGGVS
jgi:YHS domain-containing protein